MCIRDRYRTEYSIKALEDAGLEVNCLDDQVGMWDQATAQQLVANSLSQNGNDIEVVFCNKDVYKRQVACSRLLEGVFSGMQRAKILWSPRP